MQLIVGMNRVLQQFIPEQVARYDDEFEPRAFGDNIQKWGTTLVLIESGGYNGDSEKMEIRQLNFVAILSALKAIADSSYTQEDIAELPGYSRKQPGFVRCADSQRTTVPREARGGRYWHQSQRSKWQRRPAHFRTKAASKTLATSRRFMA